MHAVAPISNTIVGWYVATYRQLTNLPQIKNTAEALLKEHPFLQKNEYPQYTCRWSLVICGSTLLTVSGFLMENYGLKTGVATSCGSGFSRRFHCMIQSTS